MIIDDYVKENGMKYKSFAELVGVSVNVVYLWRSGARHPSRFTCMHIERVTKGKVKAKDLRPDLLS